MKKNLLLLFSLLTITFALSSCGGVDPVKYNDKLIDNLNNADKRVQALNDKLDAIDDLENFTDSIKSLGAVTIDSLKSDIHKISLMEKAKGSEEFETSVIAYIESLITYTETITGEYAKVNEETSEEDFNDMSKKIDDSSEAVNKKMTQTQEIQKAFAKANNFILK